MWQGGKPVRCRSKGEELKKEGIFVNTMTCFASTGLERALWWNVKCFNPSAAGIFFQGTLPMPGFCFAAQMHLKQGTWKRIVLLFTGGVFRIHQQFLNFSIHSKVRNIHNIHSPFRNKRRKRKHHGWEKFVQEHPHVADRCNYIKRNCFDAFAYRWCWISKPNLSFRL